MLGRGAAALIIAMFVLVAAVNADAGRFARGAETSLSVKRLAEKPGSLNAGLNLRANPGSSKTARQISRSQFSKTMELPINLIHAGVDLRAIIADVSFYLTWAKNSLQDSYRRFPAVVMGLAALVILPLLALPGLGYRLTRKVKRGLSNRLRQRRARARQRAISQEGTQRPAVSSRPQIGQGWIEVEDRIDGGGATKARLEGEMLRIGRESDNDICLDAKSVHRYHALVHRTPERDVLITDLSGEYGNGMWVNGTRLQSVVLHHGDRIQLGQVRLRYDMGHS